MRFAYYDKLSPSGQRTYRKSDAIVTLGLPPGLECGSLVDAIGEGLRQDRRADVQSGMPEFNRCAGLGLSRAARSGDGAGHSACGWHG